MFFDLAVADGDCAVVLCWHDFEGFFGFFEGEFSDGAVLAGEVEGVFVEAGVPNWTADFGFADSVEIDEVDFDYGAVESG